MSRIIGGATIWARQTLESEVFLNKPDKWFKIWFYIINKANHIDNGKFKRGQAFVKYEWITEGTGATKAQIDHFIRWAKEAQMLATEKATRGMFINVLKYEVFQDLDNYKSDTKSDLEATQKRHRSDTINNNDNNDKNENKENIATPHGQLEEKPKEKPLTNIQQVVNYFFSLKGWDINGSGGDKVYSRYVRPAKDLLGLCENSVSEAQACIKKIADWADSRNLDWGLETIFKKWYELDLLKPKEKKPYYEGNRIFEMGGKRFVLMPNGEKMEFAGKESEIKYK